MPDYAAAYGGAGAGDALKELLTRKLLDAKFAEEQRQAQAREAADVAQRTQQADLFRQGQTQRQAEFIGQRDENYQNRMQDVKRHDLQILEKEKDRSLDKELRRVDAEAREKENVAQRAFTAEEHRLTRELTQSEGAATRGAMAARAREAAQERGSRPLSADQELKWTDSMAQKYLSNTKGARESIRNYALMESSLKVINSTIPGTKGYGTAEQGIVNGFNKILDSNSVVREGEYDRTKQGLSLLAKIEAFSQGLTKGGTIPPAELQAMADLSRTWAEQAKNFADEQKALTTKRAVAFGLRPELIFLDDEEKAASHEGLGGAPPASTRPGAPPPVVPPGMKLQTNTRTGETRVVPR